MQTKSPRKVNHQHIDLEMELWLKEEGLVEELLGLREMDYYINQDLNIAAGGWNDILEDFSFPTNTNTNTNSNTSSCFQDDEYLSHQTLYSAPFGDDTRIFDSLTFPYLDPCKPEPEPAGKPKKLNGQPSKNLMAERRRRKRLNDRLSMLRSLVPKITKRDRTSILGDTIEYTKELLDSIMKLQEEMNLGANDINELGLLTIFKNAKPEEIFIRNSPKFEVERRNSETRIEICCGAKPGLLLSTVTTLEAFGFDIEHCVISCFNDFSMQASCSHSHSHSQQERAALDSEEIKQALFRNAGYIYGDGGRSCL